MKSVKLSKKNFLRRFTKKKTIQEEVLTVEECYRIADEILNELFSKLDMDKDELEMIKFENKLEDLNSSEDNKNLDNERVFIRKKIDEINGQINQLENNLQFFTNVDNDNPVLQEVHKNIENHKDELSLWKKKLSKIKELY